MLRDLIQEAEKWDLTLKPASLWWKSTYDSEDKTDLSSGTKTGSHILGCTMNRQGKTHEVPRRKVAIRKQGLVDGTWSAYYTRTCKIARKIWVNMELPFVV